MALHKKWKILLDLMQKHCTMSKGRLSSLNYWRVDFHTCCRVLLWSHLFLHVTSNIENPSKFPFGSMFCKGTYVPYFICRVCCRKCVDMDMCEELALAGVRLFTPHLKEVICWHPFAFLQQPHCSCLMHIHLSIFVFNWQIGTILSSMGWFVYVRSTDYTTWLSSTEHTQVLIG